MSVSDSFEKSDTSSNSSRSKVKSPHTVLKENQSNVEPKQTTNNNVSTLIKEDQVDHYVRLLKQTEVTLKDKDSLISILKQQIKTVEDSLRNTLDQLQEINFKYSVTQQELSNLKQISEKYKEDVNTLLKNAKNESESVSTVTEAIQVEIRTTNPCDLASIKNDYGNINKAMQEQNEKIELLLNKLKSEFEHNQEKNDSQPSTSSESSPYTKCSALNKLIDENKNLKIALNKLQNENTQLIQKENNDEIGKLQQELQQLQSKISQVNESNAVLQKQIQIHQSLSKQPPPQNSKNCLCTPEKHKENYEQMNFDPKEEQKAYYIRGREGSKVGFRVESNQFQSDLMKENKDLHHTLNHLRILQSQNNGFDQLQSEIALLQQELKEKDDKLNDLKSVIERETNDRSKIIKEFTEKENQLKEDYNKILIDGDEIRNQLKQKENELNEKDDIVKQLQNEIQELKLSMNEIVCGSTEATDSRTQELKMSIETLNTLLAKSMEEKQQYIDQIANHANCKNTIDNLNEELLKNTEEIDKLNKASKDLNETIFNISNKLEQYEEEVQFRNTENDKLKHNESQLQDDIKNLQLENKDLEEEKEKTASAIMGVLEEFNVFKKQCEDKLHQLSIANSDLKKSLLEKDINIEDLKNKNKIIREELQDIKLRQENDALRTEQSVSEISVLFKSKEGELEIVAHELQLKEASLELLEKENNTLKERLSNMKEETATNENIFLKSVHQEEREKSDYDTNKYMEQLNEIKMLSINYDNAVQRNEELNIFLNKVSAELKELKLNLHKLLEDLEKKLICLKENSEQSNNLNPISKNNIKDMSECIKAFSKSIFCENQLMPERLKVDECNQVVCASKHAATDVPEINYSANSINASNLIVKRNYLIKRIKSIDEQLDQIRQSKSNDMKMGKSTCNCDSFEDDIDSLTFKRQNYIGQINTIEKELLKYSIHCDCNLNKKENYTAPNFHLAESLQIMQNMSISLCNMKEQLTTKIRDYIINKDQDIQNANDEKVVEKKSTQCAVNDEDQQSNIKNVTTEINEPKSDKEDTSKHKCSCDVPKETKLLHKNVSPEINEPKRDKEDTSKHKCSCNVPKETKPLHKNVSPEINELESDKQDFSKDMCSCDVLKETKLLYKYEKRIQEGKSINTEPQKIIIMNPENNLVPKQKDDLEPKLPHTIAKDNNPTDSKNFNKDANQDQDHSCNCGIILEDP